MKEIEPRIAEREDRDVEDVGDGACNGLVVGKGPQIGLVAEWVVGAELKLGQDLVGQDAACRGSNSLS